MAHTQRVERAAYIIAHNPVLDVWEVLKSAPGFPPISVHLTRAEALQAVKQYESE
jgi:hypothetical protein